ncbi:class I SAM-dependent methyltransferase [Faecalibacterium prausnitzii]|uniref:class I SAM-dependent methyltransferase n=1 Tax=Faecalibacterium prausnitzii TaxID=853 RepID=UPI00290F34DC|nr:class I SAM-dependent methyltransferase [Faecalibacterium prausnitzii]MDU8671234.1 class I SAM-dependent methyltransferase [Faecalibacterium prausnitzii]
MKPDYKNWIPKGMLVSLIAGTVLSLALLLVFVIFGIGVGGKLRVVLGVVFGIAFVICAKYTEWCVYAYRSFSYDGERKLSKQIIEGTAHYVTLPEGVKNALFRRGNAVKLDFPDESFDAVTSNYVYHNITGEDKQALLLETLRVLKKGGTFAIHDLMSERRYGDMQAFVQKLREMGYERVELIDTTTGKFMTPKEAKRLMLHGSTLLVGRK